MFPYVHLVSKSIDLLRKTNMIFAEGVTDREVCSHIVESALHRLYVNEYDIDASVAFIKDHVDPLVASFLKPADAPSEADDNGCECA